MVRLPVPPVLLVEHDDATRDSITRALESAGYTVRGAVDAEHALYLLNRAREAPCVILLDLQLPGMSAFDFAARTRADERFAGVPVIVMVEDGDPNDGDLPPCRKVRLARPLDAARLVQAVAAHCETRPA